MPEQRNPALRVEQVPLEHLRTLAASGELYAIADATDTPAVPKKALELGPTRAVSLYRGTAEEEFWEVAPYLMHVDAAVLDWILSTLDLTRWGIFAVSKADLKTLRTHFRHFLKVMEPEGEVWLFRFFDPRVFRPFLPACSGDELRTLFGPSCAYALSRAGTQEALFLQPGRSLTTLADQGPAPKYPTMFKLRVQHLEALRPQADAEFVKRILQHLRKTKVGDVAATPDDLLFSRIRAALTRTRSYQFELESTLVAFVALMFEFSPNFDEHPKVHSILTDRKIPVESRIDELVLRMTDSDWDEVTSQSHRKSWDVVLG